MIDPVALVYFLVDPGSITVGISAVDEMWKYAVYFADATSHSSFVIVNFSG